MTVTGHYRLDGLSVIQSTVSQHSRKLNYTTVTHTTSTYNVAEFAAHDNVENIYHGEDDTNQFTGFTNTQQWVNKISKLVYCSNT